MKETPAYASYLLRIWRSGAGAAARWHASLEDTRTGERHGFADLADAVAFLEARYCLEQPRPPAGETDLFSAG